MFHVQKFTIVKLFELNLFHASVKNKTEMEKSGCVNACADGQQNSRSHPEAGPLEDEHGRER